MLQGDIGQCSTTPPHHTHHPKRLTDAHIIGKPTVPMWSYPMQIPVHSLYSQCQMPHSKFQAHPSTQTVDTWWQMHQPPLLSSVQCLIHSTPPLYPSHYNSQYNLQYQDTREQWHHPALVSNAPPEVAQSGLPLRLISVAVATLFSNNMHISPQKWPIFWFPAPCGRRELFFFYVIYL